MCTWAFPLGRDCYFMSLTIHRKTQIQRLLKTGSWHVYFANPWFFNNSSSLQVFVTVIKALGGDSVGRGPHTQPHLSLWHTCCHISLSCCLCSYQTLCRLLDGAVPSLFPWPSVSRTPRFCHLLWLPVASLRARSLRALSSQWAALEFDPRALLQPPRANPGDSVPGPCIPQSSLSNFRTGFQWQKPKLADNFTARQNLRLT